MATAPVAPKKSFLEKLEQTVYLSYVLKAVGVIMLALGLFQGWHQLHFLPKLLLVIGPIAWYVGARFDKIYR